MFEAVLQKIIMFEAVRKKTSLREAVMVEAVLQRLSRYIARGCLTGGHRVLRPSKRTLLLDKIVHEGQTRLAKGILETRRYGGDRLSQSAYHL